ncbi:probable receptor-like protein kinase At1g80640 isoform X4 [Cucurbita maxima]|nr:probable receptor-like protein kinase At1g80640 isoform X4 [Cucurbita maxima]
MVAKMEAQSPGVPEVIRVVHHQDLNKRILVALVVSSTLLGAILLFLLCVWIYRRRTSKLDDGECRKDLEVSKSTTMNPISRFNSLRLANFKGSVSMIDYKLLEAATDNFSKSNVLDEGSTGHVYKARFDDKMLAAVKRIDYGGPDAEREFENEVNWLRKIRHQNIIKLLGHCIRDETRFLVYEMMQNGSLESQLHGPSHGSALTWHLRMKIAVDIARGLEYLHEHRSPPVVHRDLKSSNILLDSDFNAKLSDFGLTVNLGAQNKNIKLSGTLGYVAPEYLLDGKLTDKSDVYAFGVVLLELLTGKKPVETMGPTQSQSLVSWAIPQLGDRSKLPKVVDPVIRDTMDLKHLYQVAAVAVLCVQSEPSYRPLVTDVLHSLIPLVPVELGGSLRITEPLHLKEPSSTRS